jgi:hypothetical protein
MTYDAGYLRWLQVDEGDVRTKRQLGSWVTRGTTYARSLPAKKR